MINNDYKHSFTMDFDEIYDGICAWIMRRYWCTAFKLALDNFCQLFTKFNSERSTSWNDFETF